MTEEVAISLRNVSKVYKRYHRPVDRLKEILLPGKSRAEEFWALRDINLEIPKGETIGIIGRNGSGKSTILQIIAGTLQPTCGTVQVNGRVSALLELGSGFNPEFTGRQNVFFNGRILGLSQEEIENKFDEIAAFADIGEFIDEPVKTYSSGMFVRLAFAVAINTKPDILVIDEALSVGDEAFQRKCFARIYSLQEAGASILFVSHSATSIVELCSKAVFLYQGEILFQGMPKIVVAQYQRLIYSPSNQREALRKRLKESTESILHGAIPVAQVKTQKIQYYEQKASHNGSDIGKAAYDPNLKPEHTVHYHSHGAKIKNIQITGLTGKPVNSLIRNERYIYSYSVSFLEDCFKVRFGMMIKTVSGFELGGTASHPEGYEISHVPAGIMTDVQFEFSCTLLPGTYFLNAGLMGRINDSDTYLDRCVDALMFRVQPEPDLRPTGIIDFQIKAEISNNLIYL